MNAVYGTIASIQLTSDSNPDDYTSIAECPHGHVALGCQSITTGCDHEGSAYRETHKRCVTWNSMTFWGTDCPDSTVQAVAICTKLPDDKFKVHYKDEVGVATCEQYPGSSLVSCTCALILGDVACAGTMVIGQGCVASISSENVTVGVGCVDGDVVVETIAIDVVAGHGVGKCSEGYSITDCTCGGTACLKKTFSENKCKVKVDMNDSHFYGASAICAKFEV